MICILTDKRHVKSQLSLLLRDLGYAPAFFDSLASYESDSGASESRQPVLIDLELPASESASRGIKLVRPNMRVVGFVCYDPSKDASEAPIKPEGLDGFFLLPSHADRAKARIISALRAQTSRAPFRRGMTNSPFGNLLKRPGGHSHGGAKRSCVASDIPEILDARYLETKSITSRNFVHQMRRVDHSVSLVIIKGKEGAEFELAAREFNYQHTSDTEQLLFGDSDGLSIDGLEKLEKAAVKDRKKRLCFVGRCDELTVDSAQQLALFLEFLANLRNPHLRIILAHEYDSEPYFQEGVESVLRPFFNRAINLKLPGMDERPEDIRPTSMALISTLRAAHPFLRVKGLTEEAIQYLTEMRHELSHAKLYRMLRNACALSQRECLSSDDLRNYGERETSTSHLVESMADERFFPSQEAI